MLKPKILFKDQMVKFQRSDEGKASSTLEIFISN